MKDLNENYLKILQSTELFDNINERNLNEMLGYLDARISAVKKKILLY